MPNCDFYALGEDATSIIHFVFSQPGWTLCELSSRPDSELRQFAMPDDVFCAFDFSATDVHLHLHAPEMLGRIHIKRIVFNRDAVPGTTYRHDSHGWGLVQLYLRAPRGGRLPACHTNHNSERRARAWEPTYPNDSDRVSDWDWRAVTRVSSRLNRFIRSVAVSKSGSRPVLRCAHEAASTRELQLVP